MRVRIAFASLLLRFVFLAPVGAADAGGNAGGGNPVCTALCHLVHGSGTIPSGDPDIRPLKDPFCVERCSARLARCNGGGSGGGGVLFIGLDQRGDACPAQTLASGCQVPTSG